MRHERPDAPVLVTQSQLTRYAGSEMAVLELVDQLNSRGTRVIVVAHVLGEQLTAELTASGLTDVYLSDAEDLDERLLADPPAWAWIQHQLVPDALLRGDVRCPILFAHLSGILMIEHPLLPAVEEALGAVLAYNSPETLARQQRSGLLDGIDESKLLVLGNPAPDAFARIAASEHGGRPRLLVVSNHIPEEISEAVAGLEDTFETRLVGREQAKGASSVRVTPEVIEAADAVVTIGKTVQYALLGGRPVYCYDHFGGPGWLDDENVDEARRRNFSGRGFDSRSADAIVAELRDGFEAAREWALSRQAWAVEQFGLGRVLERVEERLAEAGPPARPLDAGLVAAHRALQELLRRYVVDWAGSVERGERLEEVIRGLRENETRIEAGLARRDEEIERLEASRKAVEEHAGRLEESRDRFKARVDELDAERSRVREELAGRSRELDAAKAELERCRAELAEARSGLAWKAAQLGRRMRGAKDDR